VYVLAVYLPSSRVPHGAARAMSGAARLLDPGRDVREAREAFDVSPSAQNQMRLAQATLDSGDPAEAARLFEGALQGPFANDPDLRFGAASAFLECDRFEAALPHLQALHTERPAFRADQVMLLLARAHAGLNQDVEARQCFEAAVSRFGSFEANAEYAIWALARADAATAERLERDIQAQVRLWTPAARQLNQRVLQRLKAAQDRARRA
jgi:hypothetical protein